MCRSAPSAPISRDASSSSSASSSRPRARSKREEIHQRIWGYAMVHGDRSVDVSIRELRQKLERCAGLAQHPHALRHRLPLRGRADRRRHRRAGGDVHAGHSAGRVSADRLTRGSRRAPSRCPATRRRVRWDSSELERRLASWPRLPPHRPADTRAGPASRPGSLTGATRARDEQPSWRSPTNVSGPQRSTRSPSCVSARRQPAQTGRWAWRHRVQHCWSTTPAPTLHRDALEHLESSGCEVDACRARLLYGEWLRREGQPTGRPRPPARRARGGFAAMGAPGFAERALQELRATGERARRRTSGPLTSSRPRSCTSRDSSARARHRRKWHPSSS